MPAFSKQRLKLIRCCFKIGSRLAPNINRNPTKTHSKKQSIFVTILQPLLNDFGFNFGNPGGVQRTSFSLPETPLPTFWRPRLQQGPHRDPKAPKMEPQDSQNYAEMTSKPPKTEPRRAPDPKNGATALPKQIQNRESKKFDYKQSYLHYVLSR